jgi:hypothetical protein
MKRLIVLLLAVRPNWINKYCEYQDKQFTQAFLPESINRE